MSKNTGSHIHPQPTNPPAEIAKFALRDSKPGLIFEPKHSASIGPFHFDGAILARDRLEEFLLEVKVLTMAAKHHEHPSKEQASSGGGGASSGVTRTD